jgi:hypothetical protein
LKITSPGFGVGVAVGVGVFVGWGVAVGGGVLVGNGVGVSVGEGVAVGGVKVLQANRVKTTNNKTTGKFRLGIIRIPPYRKYS